MLSLSLMLVVTFVSLMILLWIGTYIFQGYIYTEPSQQLNWQAPAAALLLTSILSIWCFSVALTANASPRNVPIDSLFRFSAREDMLDRPAAKLWAIKRSNKKSAAQTKEEDPNRYEYVSKRDLQRRFHYEDTTLVHRPWHWQDVVAIEMVHEKQKGEETKIRFDLVPAEPGEDASYRRFVSADGWVMKEYEDGPTGLPERFRLGRLLLNLGFNFTHLLCWFIALCLLLRFQWAHALGFAVVLWALCTLTLLPAMLTYSAYVAETRKSALP